MNSIYASKLYRASKRKDRIQAALNSASNFSLVQQLADSLDEEYRTPKNLGIEEELKELKRKQEEGLFVDEKIDPNEDLMTVDELSSKKSSGGFKSSGGGSLGGGPKHKPAPGTDSDGESPDLDSPGSDTGDDGSKKVDEAPADKPEETEASTKIHACDDISLNLIKESLNNERTELGKSVLKQLLEQIQ